MNPTRFLSYACATLLITLVNDACAIPITCERLCPSLTDASSMIYEICGCADPINPKRQVSSSVLQDLLNVLHLHHDHTLKHHITNPATQLTTTTRMTTTTDICIVLCAAQLGGSACECSMPGFPGRK